MARDRSPDRDKAFEIWKDSSGQMKLKDIADHLGISEGTVRGWKNKDKWDDQLNGTFQKEKRNAPKVKERSKAKSGESKSKPAPQDTTFEDVTGDLELTPSQRKFVYEYSIDFNATQAAIRAGYSPDSAHVQGPRLLGNARVLEAVNKLIAQQLVTVDVKANDIIEQYKKIAFADLREFVTWQSERVVVGQDAETGEDISNIITRIELKPSSEVDGTIISEITESQGKNGPKHSIKLSDRLKALDALSKHINLFADRDKRRVEELRLQLELEKVKLDRERLALQLMKVTGEDLDGEQEDDGFEDAWEGKVEEVWKDYEPDKGD